MDLGKPIAKGNTAEVYLCDGKIIKLFKESMPENEAEYEANKQRCAYSCNLPVPRIYDVTVIGKRQAIIMEHIDGNTMGSLLFDNFSMVEYYMKLSVDTQLSIHEIKAVEIELMNDKLTRQLSQASVLNNRQKDLLIHELHSMRFDIMLCHGDYHVFNLLMAERDTVIIDWVDASAGDIKADVCRSYLLYSQNSIELAAMYLRLYCEHSGTAESDILKWEPIVAGARLSEGIPAKNKERLLEIVNKFTGVY